MKSMKSILVLGALLTTGVAHADMQLNCTSYLKEYDLKVTVGQRAARVDVIRAEPTGSDFNLKAGQSVKLDLSSPNSPEWLIGVGQVEGEQTLSLNMNRGELAKANPRIFMTISLSWTSTIGLHHQLECTK